MKHIFFDVETNGLPHRYDVDFVEDSGNWNSVRIVQIAWQVFALGKITCERSFVINPRGFMIDEEVAKIHGITQGRAEQEGISIEQALDHFMKDFVGCDIFVCHNVNFDMNVVGSELLRAGKDHKKVRDSRSFCTMLGSMHFVALPGKNGRIKWPRLQELHYSLFREHFDGAHDALADVRATSRCFFELIRLGVIDLG